MKLGNWSGILVQLFQRTFLKVIVFYPLQFEMTLIFKKNSNPDLVGDVMDSDVMHGCSITLKQSVEVSPTMSETQNRHIVSLSMQFTIFIHTPNRKYIIGTKT